MIRTISYDEWTAEGTRRFGADMMTWRFICPGCQQEQSPNDFRPFAAQGATPNAAYNQCLGRFLPRSDTRSWASDKPNGKRCDYAAFGLFNITKTQVDGPNGQTISVFEFGDPVTVPA